MSCGQIIHNGIPLDTEANFLRLTRNVEELTDLTQIKVDGALGFGMPDTETNRKYLRPLISPHGVDRSEWIEVEVHAGGHVLQFTRLFVLGYARGRYEVELRLPETHWTEQAKNLKIKDIDISDIELSEANIVDSWDNVPYADGNSEWVFPLAFYGTFMRKRFFAVEDFRPFIYDLALLKKGFCQIGWQFDSPILESDAGRKNASYLIDQKYYEESEFTSENVVIINFEGDTFGNQTWDIIQDPNGYFTEQGAGLGSFERVGLWGLDIEWVVQPDSSHPLFLSFIDALMLVRENFDGLQVDVIRDAIQESTRSPIQRKYSARVQLGLTDFLTFSISSGFSEASGTIKLTPIVLIPTEGHIYEWKDMVDPELTLFDFLRAKQHQFNGLINENAIERKLTLYPPRTLEWGEDTVNGYVSNVLKDLNSKKLWESERLENREATEPRNVRIKYKDANDTFIEDAELFSKLIDLGSGTNETKDIENPLFEPTILVNKPTLASGSSNVFIPSLSDNDDDEFSTRIGPRNLLVGERRIWWEKIPTSNAFRAFSIRLFGLSSFQSSLCAAWMSPHYQIQLGGGAYELPDYNLVFGDLDNDLGSKFWLSDLLEKQKAIGIQTLLQLTKGDFFSWSFRDQYTFDVLGKMLLVRAEVINDFQPCSEISTPVDFRPIRIFQDCEIVPANDCANFPTLIIENALNCWSWSTGGEFEETPTIILEYRYVTQTVWTEASELCNPTDGFFVRARFQFDDCPDLFLVRYVDACGNSPLLIFSFDGECITIEVGGNFVSEVQSSTISYTIDGGSPTLYTEPVCNPEGEVCATALVEYVGECPDSEIEGCFEVDASQCDNNDATFTIVENSGVVSFTRDQTLILTPQIDQFHYKLNEADEWRIWGGEKIIGCELWVKRVVIFCDTCPSICSDVVHYTFTSGGVNFEVYQIGNTLKAFGACSYEWYEGETLLGTADTLETTCSGTITVKGICGTCESEKTVDFCGGCPTIEATPVNYVPAATGNLNNLCQFIIDSKGQSWFIDSDGNAKLLSAVAGVQKFTGATGMFVTITNFDLPSDLLTSEEISKKLIVNRQTNVQIYDESFTVDSANNRVYFAWELENEVIEVILLN